MKWCATRWIALGVALSVSCRDEPPLDVATRGDVHDSLDAGTARPDLPSARPSLDASTLTEAGYAYEELLPDPAEYDGVVPECGANELPCLGVCIDLTPDPCGAYPQCTAGLVTSVDAVASEAPGWGDVDRLGVGRGGAALSVGHDGDATVVWVARDWQRLCTRRYDPIRERWSSPVELDASARQVQIIGMGTHTSGDVSFVWVHRSSDAVPDERLMHRSYSAADDTWREARELARVSTSEGSFEPGSLEVDASGQALLLWAIVRPGPDETATSAELFASWLDARGELLKPTVELTSGLRDNRYFPDLTLAPNGSAWAIWTEGLTQSRSVRARRYDPDMDAWGATHILAESAQANIARIVANGRGDVMAAWVAGGDAVQARHLGQSGEEWEPLLRLDDDEAQDGPVEIALPDSGHAFATWRNHGLRDERRGDVFVSRRETSEGAWSSPARVSMTPEPGNPPAVTSDDNGNATVLWIARDQSGGALHAQRYSAGAGAWQEPQVVTSTIHGTWADMRPSAASDASGGVTVLWTDPVVTETLNRNYPVRINVTRFSQH